MSSGCQGCQGQYVKPLSLHICVAFSDCYAGRSPFRAVVRTGSGRTYEAEDESEAVTTCRVVLKTLEGEGPGQDPKQAKPVTGSRAVRAVSELLAAKAPQHPIAMTDGHDIRFYFAEDNRLNPPWKVE